MEDHTGKTELEQLVDSIREAGESARIHPCHVNLMLEHTETIEPFSNITELVATARSDDQPWKDLLFLKLFPNTKKLRIYGHYQRNEQPMTFEGIQNCPWMEIVEYENLASGPPILTGIEYCTNLRQFLVGVKHQGDRPMDIVSLSELPKLRVIECEFTNWCDFRGFMVETNGLDLSGCKSLGALSLCPTSKDLRFLGSLQLKILSVSDSGITSLDGLDPGRLRGLRVEGNQIKCIEVLRGAKLEKTICRFEGNPIDPEVLKEISRTWIDNDRE